MPSVREIRQNGYMTAGTPHSYDEHTGEGFPDYTGAHILIVDDEPSIVELLKVSLEFQGFVVSTAQNGDEALARARAHRPDAGIFDIMMPGMDGFRLLQRMREEGHHCPILFLTAKDEVSQRVKGLTAGADDYVTKPFSLEEVITRLRTILRRSSASEAPASSVLSFADITIDENTHEVYKAGELVSLTPTEFDLLRYFLLNAGIVLSKSRILDAVWHYDFQGDANIVESYVSYLRKKIDTGPVKYLHTLRGVGYVLREPRNRSEQGTHEG